jgi:hypothetical protein
MWQAACSALAAVCYLLVHPVPQAVPCLPVVMSKQGSTEALIGGTESVQVGGADSGSVWEAWRLLYKHMVCRWTC